MKKFLILAGICLVMSANVIGQDFNQRQGGQRSRRSMDAVVDTAIINHLNISADVLQKVYDLQKSKQEEQQKQDTVTKNISSMVFKGGQDRGEALSEREKDVIVSLVQGMSNKEIADHLCISTNTVITHRRNIARKLQIHSPAGLTIYAIVNGLVDISAVKL